MERLEVNWQLSNLVTVVEGYIGKTVLAERCGSEDFPLVLSEVMVTEVLVTLYREVTVPLEVVGNATTLTIVLFPSDDLAMLSHFLFVVPYWDEEI